MKQKHVLWSIAALVVVILAYADSFHNGFHFDDFHTVVENPWIRSLRNVPRFFTDATTFSVLPTNRTWRPLVTTSLAVDYALGHGYKPVWFHVIPFAAYLAQLGAMALLFWCVLRRVPCPSDTRLIALAAATWYGVHPAMAETVNYIIQRGDIFCTAGVVAALAFYVCRPRLRHTGLYLLPFAFGLLSKPPAIVLPALLFAYVAYFEAVPERRWKQAAMAALPSTAVGVVLMGLQSAMTPRSFTPSTISGFAYVLTQPFVLLRYFCSFFLPLHLSVDTDLQPFSELNVEALFGILFLLLLIAAIVFAARRVRLRPVSFGLLWFLLASLPTSLYRLAEVENDHRMYMPFVGLVLAVTWSAVLLVEAIARRKPQWTALRACAIAVFCLLLSVYAYGTHLRNRVWRTDETLWYDNVQKNPHNGRGLMNYGLTQMSKGAYPVALDYFQRALLFTPNYPILEINLGIVNGLMNNESTAEPHFRRAVALAPQSADSYYYFGRWLFQVGRIPEAVSHLEAAVRLNPDQLAARSLLIQAYSLSGNSESARRLAQDTLALAPAESVAARYLANSAALDLDNWIDLSLKKYRHQDYEGCISAATQALKLNPRSALAYNNIGSAYAAMGQWQLAIGNVKQALALSPDFQLAKNNLALYESRMAGEGKAESTPEGLLSKSLVLNRAGRYRESIAAARAALKLRPDYAEAWNNIAAGYQSLGIWDEAIAAAQQAVRLKPDFQLAKNNLVWSLEQKRKQTAR